jgi:hypothetical protein
MSRFIDFARVAGVLCLLAPPPAGAETVKEDKGHVYRWNRFTDDLYALHRQQLHGCEVREEVSTGGYPGRPAFYRQVEYFDAATGRLLSVIQWETADPERIHSITVYRYDAQGRLARDYSSSYLPDYRNAPTQTLVFLHYYHDSLHAFRSFDASDDLLYERCEGEFNGERVLIGMDIDEIEEAAGELYQHNSGIMAEPVYAHCFGGLPDSARTALPPR